VQPSLSLAKTRTSLAGQRTDLARERTFAAWLRTTLAYLGGGLGLAKIGWEREDLWVARVIALLLVSTGALIHGHSVLSVRRWHLMDGGQVAIPWLFWVLLPVGFLAALGAVALIFV
jgi:putative membrane protein